MLIPLYPLNQCPFLRLFLREEQSDQGGPVEAWSVWSGEPAVHQLSHKEVPGRQQVLLVAAVLI
jgi:hypothetical protein